MLLKNIAVAGVALMLAMPCQTSEIAQYEEYKGKCALEVSAAYDYTDEDVWYLSHIIAEECGDPWCKDETQFYVGSVVLNRVESPLFPNNIRDVILSPGQYTNTSVLSRYEPSERVMEVTYDLLHEGSVLPPEVVFHANFHQGSGVHTVSDTIYFCYK